MAFVSNEEINAIRAKADIISIIGSYIPLNHTGKNNYSCFCPFHTHNYRTPSMSVSADKQIFTCFSCGKTGNVFTFVQEKEEVSFIEAVAIVANKCGMELSQDVFNSNQTQVFKREHEIMELSQMFYLNNLRTDAGKEAVKYLNDRGLTDEIIKEYGVGLSLDSYNTLLQFLNKKNYETKELVDLGLVNDYDDKTYDTFRGRIMFPLWDKNGNVIGFSARIYRGEQDVAKYMNTRETKIFVKGETLYNYHKAKEVAKREKQIIVVEGFMDAIRIASIGLKNVVALQGTAMTIDQINLLKKLKANVILCLDNDSAGLESTVKNGEELEKNGVETYVIRLSGEKDPDEYIIANGSEAFIENVNNPLTFFEFKMNYFKQNKNLEKEEDLTKYVHDVLNMLANSDDLILREATLKRLSKDYDFSLEVLKQELEKKLDTSTPVVVKKEIVGEPKKEVVTKDKYMKGAEKILYFMMNGEEYISRYQKKLAFFNDPVYREIANEIIYFCETNGTITVADFVTYVTDKSEIKDKVMEIVNDSVNDEITVEAMDEYILAVSKVMTQNEIKRLKNLLVKELDVDKKKKIMLQIVELKKEDV